jgi:ribosomal protein L7Ae-like RNA K-turn-binding protein
MAANKDEADGRTGAQSHEPLLNLLGLGVRGGNVIVGVDGIRAELQAGKLRCVVLASDASKRALEKLVPLAQGTEVPLLAGPDAAMLGDRLGRPPVQAVGVRDRALANGVVRAARPWA